MANQAVSDFTKAMMKKASMVKEASKHKPVSYDIRLPVGTYHVRPVAAKTGLTKKGDPHVSIAMVVESPEVTTEGVSTENQKVYLSHFIAGNKFRSEQDNLNALFGDLQLMGIPVDNFTAVDIEPAVGKLIEDKPLVEIKVGQGKSRKWMNVVGLSQIPPKEDKQDVPFGPTQTDDTQSSDDDMFEDFDIE